MIDTGGGGRRVYTVIIVTFPVEIGNLGKFYFSLIQTYDKEKGKRKILGTHILATPEHQR